LWGPSDKSIDYDYLDGARSNHDFVANFGTYTQNVTDDVLAAYGEPWKSQL